MEAEIATGEDGNERSIECLSLIDAVMPDVVANASRKHPERAGGGVVEGPKGGPRTQVDVSNSGVCPTFRQKDASDLWKKKFSPIERHNDCLNVTVPLKVVAISFTLGERHQL